MSNAERLLYTTAGFTPPETPEQKREREHREWVQSLRLDLPAPKITEFDVVRSVKTGRGVWRSIELIRADAIAEKERARRDREAPELLILPDPEFD